MSEYCYNWGLATGCGHRRSFWHTGSSFSIGFCLLVCDHLVKIHQGIRDDLCIWGGYKCHAPIKKKKDLKKQDLEKWGGLLIITQLL